MKKLKEKETAFIRLEKLIRHSKLTQKEVSKVLSISESTVSNWERGFGKIRAPYLLRISDIFEVSVDYLVGATNIDVLPDVHDKVKCIIEIKDLLLKLNQKKNKISKNQIVHLNKDTLTSLPLKVNELINDTFSAVSV